MFPYNSIKVPLFVSLSLSSPCFAADEEIADDEMRTAVKGCHRERVNYLSRATSNSQKLYSKEEMLLNDKQIWCLTVVRGVGGRRKNVLAFSIHPLPCLLSVQWVFSWKSFWTAQARPLTNISISRHLIVLARLQRHSWMFSINFTQKSFNWISHMFLNFSSLSLLHCTMGKRCRHDKE